MKQIAISAAFASALLLSSCSHTREIVVIEKKPAPVKVTPKKPTAPATISKATPEQTVIQHGGSF